MLFVINLPRPPTPIQPSFILIIIMEKILIDYDMLIRLKVMEKILLTESIWVFVHALIHFIINMNSICSLDTNIRLYDDIIFWCDRIRYVITSFIYIKDILVYVSKRKLLLSLKTNWIHDTTNVVPTIYCNVLR